MFKQLAAILVAVVAPLAHAGDEGKLMSDLETQTVVAQKRLGLLQAQAAISAFNGTGGQPLPQIISLYSSVGKTRALIDMGAAGIREVGPGDTLTDTLVVSRIDASQGVEVRVVGASKGSAATLHLAMKATAVSSPIGSPSTTTPPVASNPGYPLVPSGLMVPPLQPLPPAR